MDASYKRVLNSVYAFSKKVLLCNRCNEGNSGPIHYNDIVDELAI